MTDRSSILTGMALTKHQQTLRAKWVRVKGCSQLSWTKAEQARVRRENRKRRAETEKRKDRIFPQTKLDVGNNGED